MPDPLQLVNEEVLPKIRLQVTSFHKLLNEGFPGSEFTNLRYKITQLFVLMRELPASKAGYHGGYPGGLFDHCVLVANWAKYLALALEKYSEAQLVKLALLHDFGKFYQYKNLLSPGFGVVEQYFVEHTPLYEVENWLATRHHLSGTSVHVAAGLWIIFNLGISLTPEEVLAIVFHHGGWSHLQLPDGDRSTPLAAILHTADLQCARVLEI